MDSSYKTVEWTISTVLFISCPTSSICPFDHLTPACAEDFTRRDGVPHSKSHVQWGGRLTSLSKKKVPWTFLLAVRRYLAQRFKPFNSNSIPYCRLPNSILSLFAMDPSNPAQPPADTAYTVADNPVEQNRAERRYAESGDQANTANLVEARERGDVALPSTHGGDGQPSSLGYGARSSAGDQAGGEVSSPPRCTDNSLT